MHFNHFQSGSITNLSPFQGTEEMLMEGYKLTSTFDAPNRNQKNGSSPTSSRAHIGSNFIISGAASIGMTPILHPL
jgi:hypothetical protein